MTSKPRFQNGSGFPNQFAQDAEKESLEYGLRVGQAIESEWFSREHDTALYNELRSEYLRRRLYAKGNQPVDKYKNELSVNGDLSYLNLDWTPIPIIPKFVDVVVNGISNRMFDVRVESLDESSNEKRQGFRDEMQADMIAKPVLEQLKKDTGVDAFNFDSNTLPDTDEELDLYMKLSYKQSIEVAEETAITSILKYNDYDEIKRRCDEDQTVLGMSVAKHKFDVHDGVRLEYVDPVNFVYSPTEDPNFRNCYYFGEVKSVHVSELKKISPDLTQDELEEIATLASRFIGNNGSQNSTSQSGLDKNEVSLLYFSYKTDKEISYKIKETVNGGKKAIQKDGSFNPPKTEQSRFTKASRRIDVWYEGVLVLGTNRLMKWELMKNMVRPSSAFQKTIPPYIVSAMKLSKGDIDSLVKRMIPFADQIQLIHLKLQQVIAKMIPDGVFIDADGLNSVDLGNGASYNPSEALNMYFQTGSVIGRSFTSDGDMNPGKVPIQEITSGSGGNKMQALIGTYNYYLQMMRDVTGLNEARDGSMPDKNALVGVQKLAAANSNVATRHILQAGLFLTAQTAECLSLRISDIIEYSPTKDAFIQAVGVHNMATLEEISELHLYDFGIFLDLVPDDEEKSILENNIQMALQQKSIDLEDAIDLRAITNIKSANELLKIRRKKKDEKDRRLQMENIQAQTESNTKAAQAAAQMDMQKTQAQNASAAELEQMKAQLEAQKMEREVGYKKELMQMEFQMNMQLKGAEVENKKFGEKEKEDRKDQRTKIQATQQSEMIEQRNGGKPPKNFESAGNDTMGGGFDLSSFDPR